VGDGFEDGWSEVLEVGEELEIVLGIDVSEDWEETIDEGEDVTVAHFGLVGLGVFEEVVTAQGGTTEEEISHVEGGGFGDRACLDAFSR